MQGTNQIRKDWIGGTANMFLSLIKQFLERTGVYLFFISLSLAYQLGWVKRHNKFSDIDIRLLLGFIIGVIVSFLIIEVIRNITVKIKATKEYKNLIDNISIALSPGIVFIFASDKKIFLLIGVLLCMLTALYIWVKPFTDYINSIINLDKFKNVLTVNDGLAVISLIGIYDKSNPKTMQSFLIDLVANFNECSEMKINTIKIDFSRLENRDENEMKSIIESVAVYFNLTTAY